MSEGGFRYVTHSKDCTDICKYDPFVCERGTLVSLDHNVLLGHFFNRIFHGMTAGDELSIKADCDTNE